MSSVEPRRPEEVTVKSLNQIEQVEVSDLPPLPGSERRAVRRTRWLTVGRIVMDFTLINLAFVLAYVVRYNLQIGSDVLEQNQVPLTVYTPIQAIFSITFVLVLQFKGFYRQKRSASLIDEIGLVLSTALVTVAAVIVLVFISRPLAFSRLLFVYLVPLTVVCLSAERWTVRRIRKSLWLRGIGVKKLLVVGATDSATRLMKAVVESPNLGYQLTGYVDDVQRFSEWIMPPRYVSGEDVPHLGRLDILAELIYQQEVDEVVIALPATHHEIINEVITRCRNIGVEFNLVPDVFELRVDSLTMQSINGIPLIGLKDNSLKGWNYIIKRTVDIALTMFVLILLSPILLLIAIAIKLDSRGPIIYRQNRVGKDGQSFTFYKFRSMRVDADAEYERLRQLNETGGATFKMKNDPRRTKVGKFLRRTSLDEIPQLFNILFGQMSWVGPRPAIDREVNEYLDWHRRRLEVTPGLTGLWQVSGRSNIPFEDMVKLDIYYAENWSIWLDINILLRTIPAVIRGDGAY